MTDRFPDHVETAMLTEPGGPTVYPTMVVRVFPNVDMGAAGFHSPDTLYVVFDSAHPVADYDEFRLARRLPGNADWVIDELHELKAELRPVTTNDGGD